MRSYVGIITSRGLEWLLPENDGVLRFLAGRAYTEWPHRAVCYWTAIQAAEAGEIQEELADGDSDRALQILQASAMFGGPILPSDVRLFDRREKPSGIL